MPAVMRQSLCESCHLAFQNLSLSSGPGLLSGTKRSGSRSFCISNTALWRTKALKYTNTIYLNPRKGKRSLAEKPVNIPEKSRITDLVLILT